MEPQVTVNRTDVVTDIYTCYGIDNISYDLTSTGNPFVICVLLYMFLLLLSVITICGNLLVIIAIIYFKQLHTPTNYLILSLSAADLLVGLIVFPFDMTFTFSSCMYHEIFFCKVRGIFDVSLSTCSVLNLCCISIDRYYAVCQPLTYKIKINHHVIVIMIMLSWGISVLIGIGVMIIGLNSEKCEENCAINILITNTIAPILSFYLPVIIMLCIYLKIFFVAQTQVRSIQNTTSRSSESRGTVSKMERKATKTLATVLGVFLLCWTPFFLYLTFMPATNGSAPVPVTETLNWLTLSNSTLNPFIYAFFYSWFRSASRMILSGKIFHGDFANIKLY